ncbi:MAG: glycosyltransferase family 2 protein [Candidatus Binatia bacterium]
MTCSVCIATFKRADLLDKLLESLVGQVLPVDVILEIIVVDNDPEGSAEEIVHKYSDTKQMTFRYFQQPVKNISLTRNVAVMNAGGRYILFVDDDEVTCRDWVLRLLTALRKYNADGVFGPVVPRFDDKAPEWIKKRISLFINTMPAVSTGTEAQATWSGNCLISSALLQQVEGPFNPDYGITGGEDTELFDRLKRNGARFIYCSEAPVFEYWPPERSQGLYLMKRSLKGTNAYTRRTIANSNRKTLMRVLMLAKSVCFGFLSSALLILSFPNKVWRTYWKMKLASNAGRLLAVFGHYYQAYR